LIVILDTGVLGLICNPNLHPNATKCTNWLYTLLARGVFVVTSELCVYEIERGLFLSAIKSGTDYGIKRLEEFREVFEFLPITPELLRESAKLWADAQSRSLGTSNPKNIDVDIILCAQWKMLQNQNPGRYVVVATENIRDISRFANADRWGNITF
jgi:hypothetical protein